MRLLRTPDERFAGLPGYSFRPNYLMVSAEGCPEIRMHYLDEGPAKGPVVLLLHGEPSWSYLYRKMIPMLTAKGYRCIAPDLIGFGRSDKPTRQSDYTHARHVAWTGDLLRQLDLKDVTLVCQDWGGLIGLRLVAGQGGRFARVVAANTALPDFPRAGVNPALSRMDTLKGVVGFGSWYLFSQLYPFWTAGQVVALGCATKLPPEVRAAYDAPFPSRDYMAGARVFPRLVPSDGANNRAAWEKLVQWGKPFLCAFSDKDPILSSFAGLFPALIPGAKGQPHTTIRGGGHFLQEDRGEELASVVAAFIEKTR